MIGSELEKTVVASVKVDEMNPHKINPADKKGKKSYKGVLKIVPKILPRQAIITPVEIVIQKGPKVDLLYLWRISDFAK